MRIAMVSEHASPLATVGGVDAGGQNVYVAGLARALAAAGHDVEVYTRRDDPDLAERVQLCAGAEVVHVPAGPATVLPKDDLLPLMPEFGRWMARDWARTGRRPDVVHAHFWMSGVAALTAVRAAGRGIPVAQTFHALGAVKRRHQGSADTSPANREETERMLAATADVVFASCTDEVAELRRAGARPAHVRVVPCGVDVKLFTPSPPRLPDRADPFGGRESGMLLAVGRLVERKGTDTVIEALVRLPGVHLVVAGGPPGDRFDDDSDVRRLRGLADRLDVGDRVHLAGPVPHEDLRRLMLRADVVVHTPWYEPFGMVPLEAMACGRPVVGTAVGGLLDTVLPGVTGALVPPRDPRALARELHIVLADPAARRAMGRAARRRAVARYGWDHVAQDVEAGYHAVAGRRLQPAEAM